MLTRFAILLGTICTFSFTANDLARAQYPSAKPNANLAEEIKADLAKDGSSRLLPLTNHFAFAGDADVYFRNDGPEEFYHGIGYWLQMRSEARLDEGFRLNVRSIFYAGSCSGGYVEPSGSYHLVSISEVAPNLVLGAKFTARALDLGRQTVGQGLMIQDHEFNGALLRFDWSPEISLILRADGTGILRLNDDTYNAEASFFGGYVGLGVIDWPQGVEQDQLAKERDPLLYAYTTHTFDWFTYAGEYGARAGIGAGLVSLAARLGDWSESAVNAFRARLKIEARRYNPNFAKDFAGQIEQQYVSYDQYDKDFTNTMNIFVVNDGANVGAIHLDAWWKINDEWRAHSLNEIGRFDYDTSDRLAYYYNRQGVDRCFTSLGKEDCLDLFFSNKVLMNSYARPPAELSRSDEPLFKTIPFFGMEARFRF